MLFLNFDAEQSAATDGNKVDDEESDGSDSGDEDSDDGHGGRKKKNHDPDELIKPVGELKPGTVLEDNDNARASR